MKFSKSLIITFIMMLVLFSVNVKAQSSAIPSTVISSFHTRYPDGKIKNWKMTSDKYVAKAIINNEKSFVWFDKNGNWENTVSKIQGTRNLPEAVNKAYNKMAYRSWHVFSVSKLVTPSGDLYHINIDDRNLQTDISHQSVLIASKTLEFKPNGTLMQVKETPDEPGLFAARSN